MVPIYLKGLGPSKFSSQNLIKAIKLKSENIKKYPLSSNNFIAFNLVVKSEIPKEF